MLEEVPAEIYEPARIMKIAVGADHAGFEYKDRIARILRDEGHEVIDFGTHDSTPVDYPQYGYAVGEAVASGQTDRGIVVCGSSLGIAMAANKVPGIRCAPVAEPQHAQPARGPSRARREVHAPRTVEVGLNRASGTRRPPVV